MTSAGAAAPRAPRRGGKARVGVESEVAEAAAGAAAGSGASEVRDAGRGREAGVEAGFLESMVVERAVLPDACFKAAS